MHSYSEQPQKRQWPRLILRVFFFSLALFLFGLQVRDVVEKYFEERTTQSMRTTTQTHIAAPAITFYPAEPYNDVRAKQIGIINTLDALLDFKNMTFQTEEVFRNITYIIDRDFKLRILTIYPNQVELKLGNNTVTKPDGSSIQVTVYETYSLFFGMAYTVQVKDDLEMSNHLFTLVLDFSDTPEEQRPTKIWAKLTEETERYGFIIAGWNGVKPLGETIKLGQTGQIFFEKAIYKASSNLGSSSSCHDYGEADSIVLCNLRAYAKELYVKMVSNCAKPCVLPVYKTLEKVAGYGMDICKKESEVLCSGVTGGGIRNNSCLEPCERTQYIGRTETQEGYVNKSTLTIQPYLASNRVTVYEEVLLFDLATFIGTFGGSLGLFIGFSFFDFTTMLSDGVINFLVRKNQG